LSVRVPIVLPLLLLALFAGALGESPAHAVMRGTLPDTSSPRDSLEVSVQVGLSGGGTFSDAREIDGTRRGDFPLEPGTAFGAAFAWGSQGRRVLELSWTHRDSRVEEQGAPAGSDPATFAVTLDDWQLEGDAQWGPLAGRHRLRAGPLLGLTRFVSNNVTRWRPTIGLGAGTRTRLAGRWIARTHLRLRLTRTGSEDPFLCEPSGQCLTFAGTSWIGRWEIGAGLAFLL
jgi:hypothetical protein